MLVRIDGHSGVTAFLPLYNGKNVIEGKTVAEVAQMVLAASGTDGTCLTYVNSIAEKLAALGIRDTAE